MTYGRLHISVRTVESHISSLLRNYGVTDRWALADEALREAPPPGHLTGLPPPREEEARKELSALHGS